MPVVSSEMLLMFAETVSALFKDSEGHMLLRVTADRGSVELAQRPIGSSGADVEAAVLGFTAPERWIAVGLHIAGAWGFGDGIPVTAAEGSDRGDADQRPDTSGAAPVEVAVTVFVDRFGGGAGVVRHGDTATVLAGSPQGFFGDALCRVLGRPTPSAPLDTVELWIRIWLDRLADAVASDGNADRFTSWPAVAALHPGITTEAAVDGPLGLALATDELARAWTWSRLREEPEVIDSAEPPMSPRLAAWMDEGMFARCVLARVPTFDALTRRLEAHLPDRIVSAVAETARHCGLRWPAES